MRGFAIGLIVGLALAGSVGAFAAEIMGGGALMGWSVIKGGQFICADPVIDDVSRAISCD